MNFSPSNSAACYHMNIYIKVLQTCKWILLSIFIYVPSSYLIQLLAVLIRNSLLRLQIHILYYCYEMWIPKWTCKKIVKPALACLRVAHSSLKNLRLFNIISSYSPLVCVLSHSLTLYHDDDDDHFILTYTFYSSLFIIIFCVLLLLLPFFFSMSLFASIFFTFRWKKKIKKCKEKDEIRNMLLCFPFISYLFIYLFYFLLSVFIPRKK